MSLKEVLMSGPRTKCCEEMSVWKQEQIVFDLSLMGFFSQYDIRWRRSEWFQVGCETFSVRATLKISGPCRPLCSHPEFTCLECISFPFSFIFIMQFIKVILEGLVKYIYIFSCALLCFVFDFTHPFWVGLFFCVCLFSE